MDKKFIMGFALAVNCILSAQVNLSQSLAACYTLDGNAIDQINNLTGTLSAVTATVDRFNNLSSALEFSGTANSLIQLPENALLKPTNAFSFSAWVKTSLIASQYVLMTRNTASSNFEAYCLNMENVSGQLRVCAKKGDGSGNAIIITGTPTLTINTWNHFVMTVDNSTMNLYSNGNLVATTTLTFAFNYMPNKNIILGGSNETIFNAPFKGTMDNLRLYNRLLDAGEVMQLYTANPACVNATSVGSFPASELRVDVFPNPSNGKFKVHTEENINEIGVYDMLGEYVFNTKDNNEIDLVAKPPGIYFARIRVNGQVISRKIIKE